MDTLEQLHVISDLHLGGERGRQIFNQGPALRALIEHLAIRAPEERLGLVLNGDIVDFLAARDATYFDPQNAVRKLRDIFDDAAFSPVWDGLASFVKRERRLLVLVIGNHDVELALPEVQEALYRRIAGDDLAARARIRMAMDGTGYSCRVGGQHVLCTHGNEADAWNAVDPDKLRKIIRALKAGATPERWIPNAGTQLVIDVMNEVKRDYAFVDLLKPESPLLSHSRGTLGPLFRILLALPRRYRLRLENFAQSLFRAGVDTVRKALGFLGEETPLAEMPEPRDALERLLGPIPQDRPAPGRRKSALSQAAEDFETWKRTARELPSSEGGLLGETQWPREDDADSLEKLRGALIKSLSGDATFGLGHPSDPTFAALDEEAGPDVRFVIAGHTHLRARIERVRARGVYFNTGTWIRLIQLTDALTSKDTFPQVFDALARGTLDALDNPELKLVLQRRTMASVWHEGGTVFGELREVSAAGAPAQDGEPWAAVPKTRYAVTKEVA